MMVIEVSRTVGIFSFSKWVYNCLAQLKSPEEPAKIEQELASTYALKSIKSPHSKLHSVRYNSLKSTVVLQITVSENHSKSLILQLLK